MSSHYVHMANASTTDEKAARVFGLVVGLLFTAVLALNALAF